MKEEIIQQLATALSALNGIPVSGKPNLANLAGSIAVIESVIERLDGAELTEKKAT